MPLNIGPMEILVLLVVVIIIVGVVAVALRLGIKGPAAAVTRRPPRRPRPTSSASSTRCISAAS